MELNFFRMADITDSRINLNRLVEYCPSDSGNGYSIFLSIENVENGIEYIYESKEKRDRILDLLDVSCKV